jgi:pseudouridine kinase
VTDSSKKEQLYELIRANPFISQQDLAVQLRLSRSAVAGYIAGLIRERRLLGRAYVLPDNRPVVCIGAANLDRKLRSHRSAADGHLESGRAGRSRSAAWRATSPRTWPAWPPVALLTAIGDDSAPAAPCCRTRKAPASTRAAACKLPDAASGTYTAVLDDHGEMVVALADMALYDRITPAFLDQPPAAARGRRADRGRPEPAADASPCCWPTRARDGVPLSSWRCLAAEDGAPAGRPAGLRLLILNRGELETRVGRALQDRGRRRRRLRECRRKARRT